MSSPHYCDRLNYEWDPDVDQFVPVIGNDLVEIRSTAAEPIAAALDDELSDSLHTRIDAWCDLHGFDTTDRETPTLVARQAVFGLLLKTTLYERTNTSRLPEKRLQVRVVNIGHDDLQIPGVATPEPADAVRTRNRSLARH